MRRHQFVGLTAEPRLQSWPKFELSFCQIRIAPCTCSHPPSHLRSSKLRWHSRIGQFEFRYCPLLRCDLGIERLSLSARLSAKTAERHHKRRCCTARSKSLTSLMPVAESPGAVRIGHPERGHLVEYLAPNSVFNSLPRQRSCSHLRPDDRFVTIDRVLHHASLGAA